MWESNPPMRLPTPNTGFEDQRAHQHPSTPILLYYRPDIENLYVQHTYKYYHKPTGIAMVKNKRKCIKKPKLLCL